MLCVPLVAVVASRLWNSLPLCVLLHCVIWLYFPLFAFSSSSKRLRIYCFGKSCKLLNNICLLLGYQDISTCEMACRHEVKNTASAFGVILSVHTTCRYLCDLIRGTEVSVGCCCLCLITCTKVVYILWSLLAHDPMSLSLFFWTICVNLESIFQAFFVNYALFT